MCPSRVLPRRGRELTRRVVKIMSVNLLQQLNTISNPNGIGIPVTTYTQEMKQVLTAQLMTAPQQQLTALNASQSALTALQSALQSFQQATYTLATSQNWNSVTASSSAPSAFTATTTSGAQPSVYSLQVTQLAQNQIDVQSTNIQTTATGSSNFTSGTITITPATLNSGQAVTVNVSAGESLNDIVTSVNQNTSVTGVQAQVINNGSGGYVLTFSSVQTGSAYGFQLGGTLIGSGTGQFQVTQSQLAQNAAINLDGITLNSATNTFSSAIPNVTVTVQQTMSSAGTLTISSDASSAISAVQNWMSSYNSLVDLIHKDTAYTPSSSSSGSNSQTGGTSGPLFSDVTTNSLLAQLPSDLNQMITTTSSAVNSLSSVGIVLNPSNGHLEFQSSSGYSFAGGSFTGTLQDGKTMFTNALAANSSAVQQLFGVVQNNTASTAIPTSGILGTLNNTLNEFLVGANGSPGFMQSDLNSIESQQQNVNNYLNQITQQINQTVANFTSQLNSLNAALQQSQAQMQQLSALFGGSGISGSSSKTTL